MESSCPKCKGEKPSIKEFIIWRSFYPNSRHMYCSRCQQQYTANILYKLKSYDNVVYGGWQICGMIFIIAIYKLFNELSYSWVLATGVIVFAYILMAVFIYTGVDFYKVDDDLCPRCMNRRPYHWDLIKHFIVCIIDRKKRGEMECSLCKRQFGYRYISIHWKALVSQLCRLIILPCVVFFAVFDILTYNITPVILLDLFWIVFSTMQVYYNFYEFQLK